MTPPEPRSDDDLGTAVGGEARQGVHPDTGLGSLSTTNDTKAVEDAAWIVAQLEAEWPRRRAGTPRRIARMGPFVDLEQIGDGGMGVVFRGFDPRASEDVAVKVPAPGRLVDPRFRRRFRVEADALKALRHPNIARFREFGEDGPFLYIASDYCHGPSLADWLKQSAEPMPPRSAARLVLTLAEALFHAHENGVYHRDLKPSNVLLPGASSDSDPEGLTPILTDFGLAKIVDPDTDQDAGEVALSAPLSATGDVLGSPPYMAPEQARGDRFEPGPWIDVYGLGALLYELLVGRPPFRGVTRAETLRAVLHDDPIPPGAARRGLPRDLETIALRCLEKKPSERYRSMNELAEDLRRFLDGRPIASKPPSIGKRALRWARRYPRLARSSAAAFLAVTILTGITLGWTLWLTSLNDQLSRERDRARRLNYTLQIQLAQRAFEEGQLGRSQRLLRDLVPAPDEPDPREFAWRYLWGLSRREARLVGEMETAANHLGRRALSRNGRWLAAMDGEGDLGLFDVQQGVRTRYSRLRTKAAVQAVAVSEDGGLVVAAFIPEDEQGRPGALRLIAWTPADDVFRDLDASLEGKDVEGLFFGVGDHLFLIAGSPAVEDEPRQTVLVKYDPRFRSDPMWIREVGLAAQNYSMEAVAPDGSTYVGMTREGGLGVYEVDGNEPHTKFEKVPSGIRPDRASFAADGRRAAVCDYGARRLGIWDAATGELLHASNDLSPGARIILQPAGQAYLAIDKDQVIRIVDPMRRSTFEIPQPDPNLGDAGAWGRRAAFTADGTGVLVEQQPYMQAGTAELFSMNDGRKRAESPGRLLGAASGWDVLDAGRDGPSLIYSEGRSIWRWDWERTLARDDDRPVMRHDDEAWAAAYSRDGSLLATGSNDTHEDTTIKIWDARTKQLLRGWKGHDATVTGLSFSPDGHWLASSSLSSEFGVRLWDVATEELIATMDWPGSAARAVAIDPTGKWLAAAGNDGALCVWRISDRSRAWSADAHSDHVHALAFAPDGDRLATGGNDLAVRIWDVESGRTAAEVRLASVVHSIAYHPAGLMIAAATKEGDIYLLDSKTASVLRILHCDDSEVRGLAFSPDGRTLAAAGAGRTVRLWDPETGHELLSLKGHKGQVNALAFAPDGSALAAVDHTGVVRIWSAAAPREQEPGR